MFIDFERQATANLLAFYTNIELSKKKNAIVRLIEAMSRNNVVFALTGSSAHFFLGMGDDFNDYDVVIEKESVDKFIDFFVNELVGRLIHEKNGKESFFDSRVFHAGELDGVEIDILSGFTVTTYNTRYTYDLRADEVVMINGHIPVCPVESSLILYGMMIQWQARRRYKYEMALQYLRQNGVNYPEILKAQDLPKFIREDIKTL